jgi:Ser-tRNA(Ala) deacylase AlaX
MNSNEYKIQIKNKLQLLDDELKDIKDNIDDYYNHTYAEVRKEILNKKEKSVKTQEETKSICNQLDFDICTQLIKKILPLRVKLFNKIHCCGFGVHNANSIQVVFYFNDNDNNMYYYNFYLPQIKVLLHIK